MTNDHKDKPQVKRYDFTLESGCVEQREAEFGEFVYFEDYYALSAQLSEAQAALKDPVKVHANMMRGIIAKPEFRAFLHLYGEVFNDLDAANVALAEAQARLAVVKCQTTVDAIEAGDHEFIDGLAARLGMRGEVEHKRFEQSDGGVIVLWDGPNLAAVAVTVRDLLNRTKCVTVNMMDAAPVAPAAQAVADDVVRDAERYRFLRDEDTNHLAGVFMVIHMEADGDMHGMQLTPEQADKAIDLAILAAQQQKVKP